MNKTLHQTLVKFPVFFQSSIYIYIYRRNKIQYIAMSVFSNIVQPYPIIKHPKPKDIEFNYILYIAKKVANIKVWTRKYFWTNNIL